MTKVRVDRLHIRLRGVSVADARRAVAGLAPALSRQLQQAPARPATVVGRVPLADRIATPLAERLRGGKR